MFKNYIAIFTFFRLKTSKLNNHMEIKTTLNYNKQFLNDKNYFKFIGFFMFKKFSLDEVRL